MLNPANFQLRLTTAGSKRTVWDDTVWLVSAYWKRITLVALVGLIVGAAYVRWHPEEYVSRATVRFIPPQVGELRHFEHGRCRWTSASSP